MFVFLRTGGLAGSVGSAGFVHSERTGTQGAGDELGPRKEHVQPGCRQEVNLIGALRGA